MGQRSLNVISHMVLMLFDGSVFFLSYLLNLLFCLTHWVHFAFWTYVTLCTILWISALLVSVLQLPLLPPIWVSFGISGVLKFGKWLVCSMYVICVCIQCMPSRIFKVSINVHFKSWPSILCKNVTVLWFSLGSTLGSKWPVKCRGVTLKKKPRKKKKP